MTLRHLLLAAVSALLCACADEPPKPSTEDDAQKPVVVVPNPESKNAIDVDDQVIAQPGAVARQVRIKAVVADGPGFVVVYALEQGRATTMLGHVSVPQGPSMGVGVLLKQDALLPASGQLIALLHRDAPEVDGVFDFGTDKGGDPPAFDAQGKLVSKAFSITVEPAPPASLEVEDQALARVSTQLMIKSVSLSEPGFVALFADQAGSPGEFLGSKALAAGDAADVKVTLLRPLQDGENIWVRLHKDVPADGVLTFDAQAGDDLPMTNGQGEEVRAPLMVAVPAGLPAAIVSLGAMGTTGYIVTATEPEGISGIPLPDPAAEDPRFVLVPGWRYRFENAMPKLHPLEFGTIDPGAEPTGDVIALSQGEGVGGLEADPAIGWVDELGAIAFTLTPSLQEALTGYRCKVHMMSMRGQITAP